MRVRKFLGIVFCVLVLFVVGRLIFEQAMFEVGYHVATARHSSAVARWWRCRNVARPMIGAPGSTWKMHYSWSGGMGPGDVSMDLSSDGHATVRSKKHDQEDWTVRSVELAPAGIAALGLIVDETGLLCQNTEQRDGYRVFDLGQYTMRIESADFARELIVDECRTIPDARALNAVFHELEKHRDRMPEVIDWGPFATASVPGSCAD